MANSAVPGPFGKRNFTKRDWLHPMDRSPFTRAKPRRLRASKYRRSERYRSQAPGQIARALHCESGADFAGVLKRALFSICEIKRPERSLTTTSVAIANNDEFLTQRALDFQPSPLTARQVRRVGLLRDDAFEPFLTSLLEELLTLARHMRAIEKSFRFTEKSFEPFFALDERQRSRDRLHPGGVDRRHKRQSSGDRRLRPTHSAAIENCFFPGHRGRPLPCPKPHRSPASLRAPMPARESFRSNLSHCG